MKKTIAIKKKPIVLRYQTSQKWITIGGVRFYSRSKWERNFARYLEYLKMMKEILLWQYEPEIFYFEGIKRGTTNYKPDFCVHGIDGKIYWYEVKGFMDPKSATKIKRFRKYFPEKTIYVVDKDWFKRHEHITSVFIKDWEV